MIAVAVLRRKCASSSWHWDGVGAFSAAFPGPSAPIGPPRWPRSSVAPRRWWSCWRWAIPTPRPRPIAVPEAARSPGSTTQGPTPRPEASVATPFHDAAPRSRARVGSYGPIRAAARHSPAKTPSYDRIRVVTRDSRSRSGSCDAVGAEAGSGIDRAAGRSRDHFGAAANLPARLVEAPESSILVDWRWIGLDSGLRRNDGQGGVDGWIDGCVCLRTGYTTPANAPVQAALLIPPRLVALRLEAPPTSRRSAPFFVIPAKAGIHAPPRRPKPRAPAQFH